MTANSVSFKWSRDALKSDADEVVLMIAIREEQGRLIKRVFVDSLNISSGNYTFSKLEPSSNYSVTAHEKLNRRWGPGSAFSFRTLQEGKCSQFYVAQW